MEPLRIFIADDHAMLRVGLRRTLEARPGTEVVGEANDAATTVDGVLATSPDILLLDLGMPGGGLNALRAVRERAPAVRVLVVTQYDDHGHLALALQHGAAGYLLKTATEEEIIEAIEMVRLGRIYMSPYLHNDSLSRRETSKGIPIEPLSPRERDVVRLVARGHTAREAAEKLGLSVKTVEAYRQRVMDKLGLESRAELVSYAIGAGLLLDEDKPAG